MRVQDVELFWQRLAGETDSPDETDRKVQLHYLAVLTAIASRSTGNDPVMLARAVMRGVDGYGRASAAYGTITGLPEKEEKI